jgi:hypothetical protein
MLSKSLLQRLLGQELPDGIIRCETYIWSITACLDAFLSLKEEFPDDYNFLARLQNMRGDASPCSFTVNSLLEIDTASAAGDVDAFDEYLLSGDKKYVVSSKIADFETIRKNLMWTISQTRR